ncbi:MAG: hypothetical protein L6416_08735 [Candidatus Omnitrophica bacterium]|nr:hypothetical protein [Candidatus Omnitrophota bacterium]
MRTLIYVPIIHTSADLGSLAKDVTKRGITDLGEDAWEGHIRTVESFWDAIIDYFASLDASGMKIYQDGMIAQGEAGAKIVEEGVRAGSKNHELIARLLKGGAVLMRTEDFNLVKEELDRILAITSAKSVAQKLAAFLKYKFIKNRLLNKRDKFIVQRINETLLDGEKGIIFIGAFHDIKKWLPKDIQIKEIKDVYKVRAYQRLLPFYPKHKDKLDELGRCLTAKINEG